MIRPALLQLDPERFRVLLGDGRPRVVTLPRAARDGLGLPGVPPLEVATHLVALVLEQGELDEGEVDLLAVAARSPGFVEELRARLA